MCYCYHARTIYGIVCNLFQPVGAPATPSNRWRRLQAVSPTELVEVDVIDEECVRFGKFCIRSDFLSRDHYILHIRIRKKHDCFDQPEMYCYVCMYLNSGSNEKIASACMHGRSWLIWLCVTIEHIRKYLSIYIYIYISTYIYIYNVCVCDETPPWLVLWHVTLLPLGHTNWCRC